jgi:hypothetical protein
MSSGQRHLIRRQVIELALPASLAEPDWGAEIARLYRHSLVPLIEKICSELCPAEHLYRIERLELDLGNLPGHDLEQELCARFEHGLRAALQGQMAQQGMPAEPESAQTGMLAGSGARARAHPGADAHANSGSHTSERAGEQADARAGTDARLHGARVSQVDAQAEAGPHGAGAHGAGAQGHPTHSRHSSNPGSPGSHTAPALFDWFVQHGTLPWWAEPQPQLLHENLQQLLQTMPDSLHRLLQKWLPDPIALRRISSQYDDSELVQLATLLAPGWDRLWLSSAPLLQRMLQAASGPGTALAAALPPERHLVWRSLLRLANQQGGSPVNPPGFGQAMLGALAAELGVTVPLLRTALWHTLPGLPPHLRAQAQPMLANWPGMADPPQAKRGRRQTQQPAAPDAPAMAHATDDRVAAERVAADNATTGQVTANRITADRGFADHAQADRSAPDRVMPDRATGASTSDLLPLLRRAQSRGGPLAEVFSCLQHWCVSLPHAAQANWLALLAGIKHSTPQALAQAIFQLLQQDSGQHGLSAAQCQALQARLPQFLPSGTTAPPSLPLGNAGLVILWPFFNHLFEHLHLLEQREFRSLAARQRAVGLLQVLANPEAAAAGAAAADQPFPEYALPLNKLLCGMEQSQPFDFGRPLKRHELNQCRQLLDAVMAQAPVLGNLSLAGLVGSFLLRNGQLSFPAGHALLQVDAQTYDIVLGRLPWSWEWIKLPWMNQPLRVEWSL